MGALIQHNLFPRLDNQPNRKRILARGSLTTSIAMWTNGSEARLSLTPDSARSLVRCP